MIKTFTYEIPVTHCRYLLVVAILMINHSMKAGYIQGILDREVSINVQGVKVKEALHQLEILADVKFVYSSDQLKLEELVTLEVHNQQLKFVLVKLLKPYAIDFALKHHNYIVLKPLRSQTESSFPSLGQRPSDSERNLRRFYGTVTDSHGTPLPGTSVLVKGSQQGTTTDAQGNFVIDAIAGDVLVFSFIGFEPYEVSVGIEQQLNVVLTENIASLDNIVVIGYGTTTKQLNTGSVATVREEEIRQQPVTNPLLAMQGRIPGVVITQQSGVPGGAININIRGRNSLRDDGNNPLYVIDGVPYTGVSISSSIISSGITQGGNPLSNLNPSDIESIEVLKDADATSIYGTRGANGVILISTRKGKDGKPSLDVNITSGVSATASRLQTLNTSQYLQMRREAFRNDGVTPTSKNARDLIVWDTTRYTNWQKDLIGNSSRTNDVQASFSGGNAQLRFMGGAAYHHETSIFPGSFSYQKGSSHISLNYTSINKKLNVNIQTSYSIEINKLPSFDFTSQVQALPPDTPSLYDSTGNINWGPSGATFNNPMALLKRKYQANTGNLINGLTFNYKLSSRFSVKTNLGYNSMFHDELSTYPKSSFNPSTYPTSSSFIGDSKINTWIVEPQLTYEQQIGKSKVEAMIGATAQQTLRDGKTLYAEGFSNDALLDNVAAAASVQVFNPLYSLYRYEAFFGRVHYDLKEKYVLNVTARRDGSSRFGPNRQFSNFGAVGAAWIFSREKLMKELIPMLSFGKLRTSYGTTGNDQIGDYQYLDSWSSSRYPYANVSGLVPDRLSNPNYGWETTRKFEAALELGFFNDRIELVTAYYRNRSSNQLVGYALPSITGFSVIQRNLPATVENFGFEFGLNTINIDHSDFRWSTAFNVTLPRNILKAYPDLASSSFANQYQVGSSLDIQKRFQVSSVDPTTGIYQFVDADNSGSAPDYPDDLKAIVKVSQKYYGGLQNTFRFKGWQLSCLIQFVKQTGRNYFATNARIPGQLGNQPSFVLDRWQKPGDHTSIQKFSQSYDEAGTAYYNFMQSDGAISDASFIRGKTLSLSYQMKSSILKKVLSGIRVYVQAQNFFTVTRYKGLDPETQSHLILPPLRTIIAGLNFSL